MHPRTVSRLPLISASWLGIEVFGAFKSDTDSPYALVTPGGVAWLAPAGATA